VDLIQPRLPEKVAIAPCSLVSRWQRRPTQNAVSDTARDHLEEKLGANPWEWVWPIAAAASFLLRWMLTIARYGRYRGEPGTYRCGNCGRTFTFFV
jgi:hypothetical protein